MVDRQAIKQAIGEALSCAKRRRFKQSIDLVMAFKGVDWSKPEQRPTIEVVLPHLPRQREVVVFADREIAREALSLGCRVITSEQIAEIRGPSAKALLKAVLLASPELMPVIAKSLGPFLAPRAKLPKALTKGDLVAAIDAAKRTVSLKPKGKCLPTLQCTIGKEDMAIEALVDNAATVLEAVEAKLGGQALSSTYVKCSMGPSIKIALK